jgi:DNA-binding response OmpR family regulator
MSSQWLAFGDRTRSGGPPPTILVVDDEQFIRTAFELYFETEGFQVLTAQDGETALRRLEEHKGRVDLIVLDLAMPGMHGLEVLRRIKDGDPAVEVIIATGCGSLEAAAEALSLGAFDYVTKPIVNLGQDLLPLVRKGLACREARLLKLQRASGGPEPPQSSWGRLALFDDLETLARQTADPIHTDETFQTLGTILAQHLLAEEIVAVAGPGEDSSHPLATWSASASQPETGGTATGGRVVAWRLPFRTALASAEPRQATLIVRSRHGREQEASLPGAGLIVLLLERLFAHATSAVA